MRKILVTIIALLSVAMLYAQKDDGFDSYSSRKMSAQENYDYDFRNAPKGGFRMGYFFPETSSDYEHAFALSMGWMYGQYIADGIYVQSGLIWTQDNWGYIKYPTNVSMDSHILSVPLVAGYTLGFGNNVSLNFGLGPRLNYTIAGKYTNDDDVTKFKDMDVDRTSLTIMAEAQLCIYCVIIGVEGHFGEDSYELWGVTLGFGF